MEDKMKDNGKTHQMSNTTRLSMREFLKLHLA